MKFNFIQSHTEFQIRVMCDVLGVSESGYHAWKSRPPSKRDKENQTVLERLKYFHQESRKTYGIDRLCDDLRDDGIPVNHKRVARLKRENNIYPKTYKKFVITTDSNHENPIAENILDRQFEQEKENAAWVSDITYLPLIKGWIYLAVIIDLYSRRVIGWKLGDHMRADLVIDAFENACINRAGEAPVLFHSDRGVQYASGDMQLCLNGRNTQASMSRKGNCWDNAVAESFFGTLKTELIGNRKYCNLNEAQSDIFDYIEVFYNRKRRHSSIGNISPAEYESGKRAA